MTALDSSRALQAEEGGRLLQDGTIVCSKEPEADCYALALCFLVTSRYTNDAGINTIAAATVVTSRLEPSGSLGFTSHSNSFDNASDTMINPIQIAYFIGYIIAFRTA